MDAAFRVLMTYPTDRHYRQAGVSFQEKIRGLELPGIAFRKGTQEPAESVLNPDSTDTASVCRCSYIGSLTLNYRDPRPAISLFSAAGNGIEMNFIGPITSGTREAFFPEGCPCRYLGSRSGDALAREYEAADVLVNIGNVADNCMPSKLFEYISTGKPIINVYKLPECPTLKYMAVYPAALCISEKEIGEHPEECAAKVREFCRKYKGKRVPEEEIRRLYAANTYDAFTETLRSAIEEAVS